MRGRVSLNGLIVGAAALVALFLTVTRPSPEGMVSFGVGDREVRAAPGAPRGSVQPKHPLSALKVFNNTLIRIRDSYVDPTRIDAAKMLYAALDSVQYNIPEVLVEAQPQAGELTVVVNDQKHSFSTAGVDSPWRLSSKLKEVFRFIEANMNPGADLAEVEYAAINGMLSTLDPHSLLLDPEMAREMDVSTRASFGGLGIVIGMKDKKLTILRPMPETPAARAGLKAKDHIYKIDDELTENLTSDEAVGRMRGKPGTKVTLTIKRGAEAPRAVPLVRASIDVPSVKGKVLDGVGYVRLLQFADDTSRRTAGLLAEFKKQGVKGVVLDLRGNPGGLLEEAIKVSDLFVGDGTIVTTVGNGERDQRRAEPSATDFGLPVVVLVSGNSASASEIVAGALKNLDRALIVGSNTFGKGSVQILYDNEDLSKLKLTIAQYLTPGDQSIQSIGITPDVELEPMVVHKQEPKAPTYVRLLPPSRSYRERDLKSHLDSTYARQGARPELALAYLFEKPKEAREEVQPDPDPEAAADDAEPEPQPEEEELDDDKIVVDFQIALARDLVKAGGVTRKAMIKTAKKVVERRRDEEGKRLSDALAGLGIDWSEAPAGTAAPTLETRFAFEGLDGNVARAGAELRLTGTVTNRGAQPAYRVHARVRSESQFNDVELPFGKIEPGQSRSFSATAKLKLYDIDQLAVLGFDVRDATGGAHRATPVKLRIEAADLPVFAYAHQLIDEGNGDGLVQPGERYRLRVTVKNTGKGVAKEPEVRLRNASGIDLSLLKAREDLGALAPGAAKTIEFAFATAATLKEPKQVVELVVYDAHTNEGVSEKLEYPVRKPSAGPVKAGGSVEVTVADTPIFEGAATDSARIASAGRGAIFKVTGAEGSWHRIDLGGGRAGFVETRATRPTSRSARPGGLADRMQVTPPSIAVEVPSFEVTGASYLLRGRASDDTHVEDVYVFVSNRAAKIDNRKVFYQSNRGGKNGGALAFAAPIPLWPGPNQVTVVSRENSNVRTTHQLVLYRADGVQTAAKAP